MVSAAIPKMPFFGGGGGCRAGGPKVGRPIGSSMGLPPGLDTGGGGRNLGVKGRTEPQNH